MGGCSRTVSQQRRQPGGVQSVAGQLRGNALLAEAMCAFRFLVSALSVDGLSFPLPSFALFQLQERRMERDIEY